MLSEEVVQNALTLVREAAETVRALRETGDFEVSLKDERPRNYLTEADTKADQILQKLTTLIPGSAYFSEEQEDDISRLASEYVWIVDPIDGTREFVEGLPQCSVSVALSHRGKIVFAAVCNPWDALIWAHGPGVQEEILDDRRIAANRRICGSRSEADDKLFDSLRGLEVQPVGSIAYKLALVSLGHFDGVISLKPKNEWDIAAGVGLIEAAGLVAVDILGRRFRFNGKNRLAGMVAGPELMVRDLLADYDLADAFEAGSPKAARALF